MSDLIEYEVGFDGSRLHKAFHDPDAGTIDLWVEGEIDGGEAIAFGDAMCLSLDAEGLTVHASIVLGELTTSSDLPQREDDARRATTAGVSVFEGAPVRGLFDATEGTLRISFGEHQATSWARLGENLIWLAIDDDACLAAFVIEGISRDPGGKAQAAWLAEMSAGS